MVKNIVWIALLVAGCAQQQVPEQTDIVDPWAPNQFAEYAPQPLPTVKQDGTSCPPNYVVKPDNPNDCTPAPGMVPVGISQPSPVAQSLDAQTRVMRDMAENQRAMRNDAREAAVQAQRAAAEDRFQRGN